MSPETFKERFGENTAIAALAVIVEDEEKDKRPPSDDLGLSFFTDSKAEDGRAWVGGFLEIVSGCQGPLEVDRSWAPWAFSKSSPNKVIAALELLATLIVVKLSGFRTRKIDRFSGWLSGVLLITSRMRH